MRLAIPRPRQRPVRPPPPTEPDSIEWNGVGINYTVVRSARRKRTITLRVLRGAVEVLAPKRTSKRDIREFVEAKSAWVLDKLAHPPVRAQVTPFGHGDTVPYLGYTRPVVLQSGTTKTVGVSLHDHFCAETDDAPDNLVLHHFHVTVPEGIDDETRPQRVRTALTTVVLGACGRMVLRGSRGVASTGGAKGQA